MKEKPYLLTASSCDKFRWSLFLFHWRLIKIKFMSHYSTGKTFTYCGKGFSFTSQTLSKTAPSLSSDTYYITEKDFLIVLNIKKRIWHLKDSFCHMSYLFQIQMSFVECLHPCVPIIWTTIRGPLRSIWNKFLPSLLATSWSRNYMHRCFVICIWFFVTAIVYLYIRNFLIIITSTFQSNTQMMDRKITWKLYMGHILS